MPITKVKPEGDYCQDIRTFSEILSCPDLDDTKVLKPRCTKYNKDLTWNTSGHVHKCKECLEQNKEQTAKST